MFFQYCYCNIHTVVLDLDNDNDSGKPAAVKTCHSLDMPLSENQLKSSSVVSTSLESVFARPGLIANDRIYEIGSMNDRDRGTTGYHVTGIGPSVSDTQVQDVIEYFQKCAADNGGYVYEFDIESDQCPQLDAAPTSNF